MRSPSALAGGLTLVGLAAIALWLTRDLAQGTLDEIGPGLLPRWLAVGVGACGVALLVLSVLRRGGALEPLPLRGLLILSIAILAFAVLVRPFSGGGVTLPGLGLVAAGPVAVFVSGLASDEADWLELAILAPGLTAFCMVLFGDLLSLQIPLYPDALLASFPAGWSPKAVLRVVAAALALVAVAYRLLFPSIVLICCIGIYSVNALPTDVIFIAFFGVVGFVLIRMGFEPAPLSFSASSSAS